jgi:hypothetical protein
MRAIVRLGLLGALVLALCGLASSASATPVFRVQRLCGAPRAAGSASCLAMKLVPASLTQATLREDATRQAAEARSGAQPAVAIKKPYAGYLTPRRLHDAYALPSETPAAATQTVAVIDAFNDPTAEADLGVYDEQFGLPACTEANDCFRKLNQEGAAKPLPPKEGEWAGEISIDVQMAHAICQNCKVLLVEANGESFGDLGKALEAAVNAGATEISNSYGGPESAASSAKLGARYFDHPGLVVTVSSGDCGYLNEACPGLRHAAEFPADSADVVAVGGTTLRDRKKVWTSTVWEEGGSGCSTVFEAPPWQTATANFVATGCGSGRSIADVSAIGDPDTGVDTYDSTPEGNGDPTGWGVWGGTSVSSPIVAAEYGLAGGAHGVPYPAATLYPHVGESGALYDVQSGSNGTCAGATSCTAAIGYDGPSGVGSPVGLAAFSTGESSGSSGLSLISFSPASARAGRWVTIAGAGFTPSSRVDFDGVPAASVTYVSSRKLRATVPAGAQTGAITVTNSSPPVGSASSSGVFTPR